MSNTRAKTRSHIGSSVALLLVVALLWVQMLGLVHRVLHAPAAFSGAPALAKAVQAGPALQQMAAPAGLLEHLFSPAKADSDCRAYDQLGQAEALPSIPVLTWHVPVPAAQEVAAVATACRSYASMFEARGPPAIR